MTVVGPRSSAPKRAEQPPSLAAAWIALLFVPVTFIAAFAIAEGLYSLTGHDPSSETPPGWASAVALIPAGLVFVAPCVVAFMQALRVVRAGRRAGYFPAVLAVVIVVAYVALNVL